MSETATMPPDSSRMMDQQANNVVQPIAAGLVTKVFRSLPELDEIREAWKAWQYHANSDFDFYSTVVRTLPGVVRPHVIALFKDGRPEALLAGRIDKRRLDFNIGYGPFFRPEARVLSIIHGGSLGNESPAICEALVAELIRNLGAGEADIAFFNHIREHSDLYRSAAILPFVLARDRFPVWNRHRTMTVPTGSAELYERLSSKARKNLKVSSQETSPGSQRRCQGALLPYRRGIRRGDGSD